MGGAVGVPEGRLDDQVGGAVRVEGLGDVMAALVVVKAEEN